MKISDQPESDENLFAKAIGDKIGGDSLNKGEGLRKNSF
jgi:hypothetical protein